MVLCDRELLAALKFGHLVIEPTPEDEAIGSSAIDLTLGEEFIRWKQDLPSGYEITIDPSAEDFDFRRLTEEAAEHVPREDDGARTPSRCSRKQREHHQLAARRRSSP